MWTDKLNVKELDVWLSRRTNRIPSGGRDPYTSSMRTASRFVSALKGDAESRESQLITDLTSAQLYDKEKAKQSDLANNLLYNCRLLEIPDGEELSIVLIVLLEGLRQHNATYQSIIRFWYYISKRIPISELSNNISVSYLISYFSVRENNYAPLEDILNDLSFTDLSSINLSDLKKLQLSANAMSGVDKLTTAIGGYTTRSSRKEMFQALDIMFSFDKLATINRICPQQKYPEINKHLKDIIALYYGYFSFSSLLFDNDSFFSLNINKKQDLMNQPLQKIYFGAPGTGKSYATNEIVSNYPDTVRTTFHPDSDYSTFVGAYKPTTTKEERYGLNGSNTVALIYPEGEHKGKSIMDLKIEYKFVKQAFLKAYIKAWNLFKDSCANGKELSPQFLVIEEINRGNCAQIFGDLFQLLDRKNGFSEYPIEADEDLQKALLEESPEDGLSFGKEGLLLTPDQMVYINQQYDIVGQPSQNVAEKVKYGQVLVLPPNLYIWATMNTSDQSLFPIDSAFKRRWEWQYVPIREGRDKDGNKLSWIIEADTQYYSWWSFVTEINKEIFKLTNSEDKKLGFFFCKASDGVVKIDTFVSKVLFYLWNDVFKDFDSDGSLFTESYDQFYDIDSKGHVFVVKEKVEAFLNKLKVKVVGDINDPDSDSGQQSDNPKNNEKFSLNGEGRYGKARIALEALKFYVKSREAITAKEIVDAWSVLGINNLVETSEAHEERELRSTDSKMSGKWNEFHLPNDEYIYITNQFPNDKINTFISAIEAQPWNIHIDRITE